MKTNEARAREARRSAAAAKTGAGDEPLSAGEVEAMRCLWDLLPADLKAEPEGALRRGRAFPRVARWVLGAAAGLAWGRSSSPPSARSRIRPAGRSASCAWMAATARWRSTPASGAATESTSVSASKSQPRSSSPSSMPISTSWQQVQKAGVLPPAKAVPVPSSRRPRGVESAILLAGAEEAPARVFLEAIAAASLSSEAIRAERRDLKQETVRECRSRRHAPSMPKP